MRNSIKRVGIQKNTMFDEDEDTLILVVDSRQYGTQRYPFSYATFINGWWDRRETVKSMHSPVKTFNGAADALHMPEPFDQAIREWKITPTLLARICSTKRQKRIKWVEPRGAWGGRR